MSKTTTDEKYKELIENLISTFPRGENIDLINAERELINAEKELFISLNYEQGALFYKLRDARKHYFEVFMEHEMKKT